MPNSTYPYDATGLATTNAIQNELHVIQPVAGINDASFVIPRAAPFYLRNLKVKRGVSDNATQLIEGVDYILTHHFVSLSYSLGTQIYSSITFLNKGFSGNVYLDYQTVGGDFVLDSYTGVEELTRNVYSVYTVTWEQVAGVIQGLAPYSHLMSGEDTIGYGELVDALRLIAATLRDIQGSGPVSSESRLQAHLDSNSAHSKASVGLGNVNNYSIASTTEAKAGTSNNRYMTPALTKVLVDAALTNKNLDGVSTALTNIQNTISNLTNRITQTSDGLGNTNGTVTSLSSAIDSLRNDLTAANQSYGNSINNTNTNVQNIANSVGGLTQEQQRIVQDLSIISASIEDINNTLANQSTANIGLNNSIGQLETLINNVLAYAQSLDPDNALVNSELYLAGYHKIKIPGKTRAVITLVGATSIVGSDPDTRLFEGSRYDAATNKYVSIVPNITTPVAVAMGAVSGILIGRSSSWSTPNTNVYPGSDATVQNNGANATYNGGEGKTVKGVVYGRGISGDINTASAGAAMLEISLSNTTESPLYYYVHVGYGHQTTTNNSLYKNTSGICTVDTTKITSGA